MKTFTYLEAQQDLSKIFDIAQQEDVEIRRKDGTLFFLSSKNKKSPFDIQGIKTRATTQQILDAVTESRMSE